MAPSIPCLRPRLRAGYARATLRLEEWRTCWARFVPQAPASLLRQIQATIRRRPARRARLPVHPPCQRHRERDRRRRPLAGEAAPVPVPLRATPATLRPAPALCAQRAAARSFPAGRALQEALVVPRPALKAARRHPAAVSLARVGAMRAELQAGRAVRPASPRWQLGAAVWVGPAALVYRRSAPRRSWEAAAQPKADPTLLGSAGTCRRRQRGKPPTRPGTLPLSCQWRCSLRRLLYGQCMCHLRLGAALCSVAFRAQPRSMRARRRTGRLPPQPP